MFGQGERRANSVKVEGLPTINVYKSLMLENLELKQITAVEKKTK